MSFYNLSKGLVLVTGPAGSGKSTTLACLVDKINHSMEKHIITLEDPIEYLHRHKMSVVTQREIVTDTDSYLTGLRASLRQAPDVILLTADTVVVLDGEVLGKPRGRDEAVRMLGRLSGRRHTVVSGVTLRTAERMHSFGARTNVWFRTLTAEETEHYIDTCRPFDKAGSYGIQEWIGYAAIERIEGSFYNVMGLPIQKVYVELDKFLDR